MAYPTTTPPSHKSAIPPKGVPPHYHVADEPRRYGLRTVIVIVVSLIATGVSIYRIRDAFSQDTPPPSPYQDLLRTNPEYAELVTAIRERDREHVSRVIAKDPSLVNFNRPEGFGPPLILAARTNQPEIIELLIDHGAKVNAKGPWGGTALHWACIRGCADAVDVLLHRGADVNARSDNDGSTPLFWACRGAGQTVWSRTNSNHAAAVKILLDSGANAETSNRDGFYAVSIASQDIVGLLVQHGATARAAATQPTFGTGEFPRWGMGPHRFSRDR
jgi:hypothetical protein